MHVCACVCVFVCVSMRVEGDHTAHPNKSALDSGLPTFFKVISLLPRQSYATQCQWNNPDLHWYNCHMNPIKTYNITSTKPSGTTPRLYFNGIQYQLHHGSDLIITWWRHQMEEFSALLAICAGNSPVPGEFLAQRPVMWSFDVFFDLRLDERLSKQSWGWWFETPSRPLWRYCNDIITQQTDLFYEDLQHIPLYYGLTLNNG